jgi:oligopeptide transport system substrate-binding protein
VHEVLRIAAIGALVLTCADAGGGASDRYYGTTKPRHAPDEVWFNLATEPEWLDPGKASDNAAGTVLFNTFAGLTQPHPQTLEPMPDVARGWTISEDGRTYTFHLRETTWSDGTPLLAEDFAWSWNRVLDRQTASKYASFLYPVRYAQAYHALAVLVTGLPVDATEAEVLALAPARAWIERVQWAPDLAEPDGSAAFLFVAADAKAAPDGDARAALVRGVDGASLRGASLRARVADRDVVGVRATGPLTLEVDLESPLPYFLDLVMFYTLFPVPRHAIEALEREGKNPALWTRPEHVVSNGAYRLAEWRFRQRMVLEKSATYWDAGNVALSRVVLSMIESATTALHMYQAGEIDTLGNAALPQELVQHLDDYADYRNAPWLGTYFFWLNTQAPPLDDVRVRQALKLALDRGAIVRFVTRAGQIATSDLVPDGLAGYRGLASPLFDPERARALLAEAGYSEGRGMPPITLIYNTNEGHRQIAQAVQQMWRDHLGIAVELENQEWKVYLKNLDAETFQIARMGWIGDYADPFTFLELLTSSSGNNHSGWSDPEYDRAMRAANETLDPTRRLALLREAEARAMDAVPIIPIYTYVQTNMMKPYVRGAWQNFQQRDLFKYWSIDERFYAGVPDVVAADPPPPLLRPSPAPRVDASAPPAQTSGARDPG